MKRLECSDSVLSLWLCGCLFPTLFLSASEGGAEQHTARRGREGWKILGVPSPPACVYPHADGLCLTVRGSEFTNQKAAGKSLTIKSFTGLENARVWEYSIILVCRSSQALPVWMGPFLSLSRDAGLGSTLTGPLRDSPEVFCRRSACQKVKLQPSLRFSFLPSRGSASVC